MKRLILIRHSLTTGNERRWYYGSADLPLSDAGRALCMTRRGQLPVSQSAQFTTTGMLRTEETLQLLFGDVPHAVFPSLREMDLGKFECRTYDDLKDDADYRRWLSDADGAFVIPGGESNAGFARRVEQGVQSLLRKYDGELVVVCHGGTIRRAMSALFPDSGRSFWDWKAEPCGGYLVDFRNGAPISYQSI